MRLTIPNPLGPPLTFDTSNFSHLSDTLSASLPSGWHRRPHVRLLSLCLVLLLVFAWRPAPPFPPSWKSEYGAERALPQLNGVEGLHHHLAVLGNRSLAFDPVVIDDTWFSFRMFGWPWRSAKIPLSAFVATTISGFEAFYQAPRAVPSPYYSSVCPSWRQRTYTLKTDSTPDGELELPADGQARLHQLQVLLAGSDDGCIRIQGEVFDDSFFDSHGPLDLLETFVASPVMKHFAFSPTVLSILNRAIPTLAPESSLYDLSGESRMWSSSPGKSSGWKHILAMHLRRGADWEDVCDEKGHRAAPFVGFNKYPPLPGNENVPTPPETVEATRMGLYRAKCLPQVLDIIARARRMRKNHPLLRSIYLLTDAHGPWLDEVRMWLESEGWDHVWVGREDIYPRWREREVGVAVDMEVARRAGVFVGNG
ncbi:hypothetical protein JCM24511_09278, partial [Saitozyma sp. JCM 24511]